VGLLQVDEESASGIAAQSPQIPQRFIPPTALEHFGNAEGHWQVNYFFLRRGVPRTA
jgi:hypothetical protein